MKKHLTSILAALGLFAVLILPAAADHIVSLESISKSNDGKTVTVVLMFTCPFDAEYFVGGSFSQQGGRNSNSANAAVNGTCTGGEQVITSLEFVSGDNLAYRPGAAQLDVIVDVYNWNPGFPPGHVNRLSTTVQLKR